MAKKYSSDYHRNKNLKHRYGITLDQYNEMLERQGNKCACCGAPKSTGLSSEVLVVDHCHKTGDIRDLLCNDCNIVLGIVKESKKHLNLLIDYIIKHSNGKTNTSIPKKSSTTV